MTNPMVEDAALEHEEVLALSDAAMRLAGHDVEDPEVRRLAYEVATGKLDVEEAIAQARRKLMK